MGQKKAKFIPSTAEQRASASTPTQDACLKNVRYLQRAAAVLEAHLLAGVEPPGYVARRIFLAAKEAGMAVTGLQPPSTRGST